MAKADGSITFTGTAGKGLLDRNRSSYVARAIMILQKLRSKLRRNGKLKFAFTSILLTISISPEIGSPLTSQFSETGFAKAKTGAGYPNLVAAFHSAERRIMERATHSYNSNSSSQSRGAADYRSSYSSAPNDGRGTEKWCPCALVFDWSSCRARFPNQAVLLNKVKVA